MPRDTMRADMPHHEMMAHMGRMGEMMGTSMTRAMAYAPAQLLERKDALQLTSQQVARLTPLRDETKRAHDASAAEAKTHWDALAQAMQANVADTTALKRHLQAAHTAMGNAQWVALRVSVQARALLNDAQRGRVEGWIDAMQMQHHMRGHDMHGPRRP
jgi:hypothetical protein